LVDDHFDHTASFLGGKANEFTGAPVGIKSVNASLDQPIDVGPELILVESTASIQGGDVWGENTGKWLVHTW
jgi:hypothetical protein